MPGTGWKAPGDRVWYSGTCTERAGSEERGPRQILHRDSGILACSRASAQLLPVTTAGASSSQPVLDVKNGTWCQ